MSSHLKRLLGLGLGVLIVAVTVAASTPAAITGPSSSQTPYLVRSIPGVVTASILTVGDSVNSKLDGTPYRLVGIPDGLGAFDNGDGTFTVLMNHELPNTVGIVRAHGAKGAFVSKWIINTSDLSVVSGEDLIQQVSTWNSATLSYNPPSKGIAIARLCSANLAAVSAFYNPATGLGYNGHIFMDGEETGAEGRAFAHLMDGNSYELPRLGKLSYENAVANPATGDATVVISTDDTNPRGQLYFYAGTKTSEGSAIDQAGLTNGTLYGLKVDGYPSEVAATGIPSGTTFSAYNFGDVSAWTGAQLDAQSVANGVTGFLRPEDGAWDPSNPSDFYFVTTASFTGPSRLWRLRFNDPANPAAGGTIDMLLDGTEGQKMMDNITVNERGQVLIQEDPGGQPYLAKVWRYDVETDTLKEVAHHDPDRFQPGASGFLTLDEESSGIIDVSDILGEGWYLLDVQAHYPTDAELVEGGQLLVMHIPPGMK